MRWLLKLDSLPTGDSLRLGWLTPWPVWVWVLVVLAILVFVALSYRGTSIKGPARMALAGIRTLLLLLVAMLLNGPVLESPLAHHIEDQVLLLLDRSGSMLVPDVEIGDSRITRDVQLRRAIDSAATVFATLNEERTLRWFGFHGHVFEQRVEPGAVLPVITDAASDHTRLDEAVAQAIAMSAGGPISAAVVLSDGRSDHDLQARHVARIRAAGVPVFVIPLGSDKAVGDLALEQVTAPEQAFTGDRVPVQVTVTRRGADGVGFDLVLRDRRTGRELDRVRVEAALADDTDVNAAEATVHETLLGIPDLGGIATWTVVIEPDQPDLVSDNNQHTIDIDLLDEPLRVLYIEGSPRWEYRYLKNLLLRESSIESSIMLLSADRSFAQEGDRPLSRLPVTQKEFDAFDVVILGDVPAGVMSPDQQARLQESIAASGTGVLWIAGEAATPRTWTNTPLADTLPFFGPLDLPAIGSDVHMVPTDEAVRLGVLQISDGGSTGWPHALQRRGFDWSALRWAQWIHADQIKPTATVLAETVYLRDDGETMPLVLSLRYGLGRSLYVATDEIWRWRFGRGEQFGEQFWIQLIRHLGRSSLYANRGLGELVPSQRQVSVGQVVQIRLRVFDESAVVGLSEQIPVSVFDVEGRLVTELVLHRSEDAGAVWSGALVPARSGTLRLVVDLPGLELETDLQIEDVSMEYRRPETNHAALADLAELTGGLVLSPDALSELLDVLPDRSQIKIDVRRAGLWDAPAVFLLIMVLLALEWTGRRLLRLA